MVPQIHYPGFFDMAERVAKLTEMGDPLVGLNQQINWEAFRGDLERVHVRCRVLPIAHAVQHHTKWPYLNRW